LEVDVEVRKDEVEVESKSRKVCHSNVIIHKSLKSNSPCQGVGVRRTILLTSTSPSTSYLLLPTSIFAIQDSLFKVTLRAKAHYVFIPCSTG